VVQETDLSRGRREVETLLHCDWASLRYQHTLALRTLLAERYKPATANKMLAALRRVLLEARRLGLMSPMTMRVQLISVRLRAVACRLVERCRWAS
jgi:hypothetical protein